MPDLKHYLLIDAPPRQVFAAITEQDGLAGWWTRQTVATGEIGGTLEFRFGDRYHDKMELTASDPEKHVAWRCYAGDEEWVGTRFTFDLEEKQGKTVLRFTHLEWRDETDFFASCNYHWGYYLRSLKLYCETGRGTPFVGS